VRTQDLVPIPGGLSNGAPALTAAVYLHFFDSNGDFGAWSPQFGSLAPSTSDWHNVVAYFTVPTTAYQMQVYLAYAAHTFTYSPNRMLGGRATGQAWLGNVTIVDNGAAPPPPSTITVPDKEIQGALEQAFACLYNSQLSGNFTVGAGYTISGNLSPDLTFGLHGVRRTAYPQYMALFQQQWASNDSAPSGVTGSYPPGGQRVMGQINWPLGVDQIFSFTGDVDYLRQNLPIIDKSLAFVNEHRDSMGLVALIPVGRGHEGGGADWVDWYKTRLDGRTFMFHMWFARTLRRVANLHNEFRFSFGNATLAKEYQAQSDELTTLLSGGTFWQGDHFLTNPDYADEGQWMDDTVWAMYHGIATHEQSETLWSGIDANTSFYEGVPIRWGAFPTSHWQCSWFGRLGAGDIMSRFASSQYRQGYSLLKRFSNVVVDHANIYEGYDMTGCGLQKCGCTTEGYGDYLEHCGGLIWAVTEGVFGLNFDTFAGYENEGTYVATMSIFTLQGLAFVSWRIASIRFYLRGAGV